ncbi:MAG: lipoate--protein ligase family protein, partial [Candidatus Omnitrophica bacterium]|nr:lipoate--protein ligase family protein [Candidatus Omnitrophota bacterium]
MLFKKISFKTPEENIVYDDVLFHLAEKNDSQEVLRLWESPDYFVVLGRISKEDEDVNALNVKKDRIKVIRRSSGGGTVLQGKGCLNYSLVLSKDKRKDLVDLKRSYQYILSKVINVLKRLNVDAEFYPISDIAIKGTKMKISGNAQKRGRSFILHHGTILYDFDIKKIEQYLLVPKDMPEYRQKRRHDEFVANIKISTLDFENEIKKEFDVDKEEHDITEKEDALLR